MSASASTLVKPVRRQATEVTTVKPVKKAAKKATEKPIRSDERATKHSWLLLSEWNVNFKSENEKSAFALTTNVEELSDKYKATQEELKKERANGSISSQQLQQFLFTLEKQYIALATTVAQYKRRHFLVNQGKVWKEF